MANKVKIEGKPGKFNLSVDGMDLGWISAYSVTRDAEVCAYLTVKIPVLEELDVKDIF